MEQAQIEEQISMMLRLADERRDREMEEEVEEMLSLGEQRRQNERQTKGMGADTTRQGTIEARRHG